MKGIIKLTIAAAVAIATVGGAATTVLAQTPHIIVVSHGQANDPFWSVVKNGVVAGAQDTGGTGD
jgi:simple sugar transport system substrate-binding protein